MGCASSKIETEEAVKRFKARKQYIKQAVAHRHAFAAAHASYAKAVKSTGGAIRQFADVEVPPDGASTITRQVLQTVSNLLPPPQPPQDPSLVPRTRLPRAASMPPIPIMSLGGSPSKSSLTSHPQPVSEDEEDSDQDQGYPQHKPTHSEPLFDPFANIEVPGTSTFDTEDFEPKGPPGAEDRGDLDGEALQRDEGHYQAERHDKKGTEDNTGFEPRIRKLPQMPVQQKTGRSDKSFGTILRSLDDLFLESYEAGREVSQLLEAQREYHHVPYVDEKSGIKEHNKKVSHILTWTKSSPESFSANDDIDVFPKDNVNLASTLDRLHAWEKKLYDEVKAAEATKLELDRRSTQLKKQKERQEGSAAIERTKACVKSLHTRYLVEFEAVDAAISEAQKLRDDSLCPQLMDLVIALRRMWTKMFDCHERQASMVEELSSLATPSTKETSDFCKKITEDLEREVVSWHDSLEKAVMFQKKCITALLEWLHLNAKQVESETVESLVASQKVDIPLYELCQAWADALNKISAEEVLQSLKRFSDILQGVATKQAEEIKQKRRKEELHKELEKKRKLLEAFESKHKERASSKGGNHEFSRHPLQERRALVDLLEKNVAEEEQRHAKMCEENSTMIFQSLKEGLPDVVYSIMVFSQSCAKQYEVLLQEIIKPE